jgi:RNA polymerase sigma-70 factor (ECF subfamily)
LEDRVLIEGALTGQTEYFDALYDRHQPWVRKRIRSMVGNGAQEDDLVQQVFLKAWSYLAQFRSESSFRTWITQITTNEVFQLHRRECRSPLYRATVDLDGLSSTLDSPQQSLERKEGAETVRRAIAGLPAIYRQILTLFYFKELSELEAAVWLQASLPLVKTRLFRARRMLVAALRKQGRRTEMARSLARERMQIPIVVARKAA